MGKLIIAVPIAIIALMVLSRKAEPSPPEPPPDGGDPVDVGDPWVRYHRASAYTTRVGRPCGYVISIHNMTTLAGRYRLEVSITTPISSVIMPLEGGLRQGELAPSEIAEFEFSFIPSMAGTYTMSLALIHSAGQHARTRPFYVYE